MGRSGGSGGFFVFSWSRSLVQVRVCCTNADVAEQLGSHCWGWVSLGRGTQSRAGTEAGLKDWGLFALLAWSAAGYFAWWESGHVGNMKGWRGWWLKEKWHECTWWSGMRNKGATVNSGKSRNCAWE